MNRKSNASKSYKLLNETFGKVRPIEARSVSIFKVATSTVYPSSPDTIKSRTLPRTLKFNVNTKNFDTRATIFSRLTKNILFEHWNFKKDILTFVEKWKMEPRHGKKIFSILSNSYLYNSPRSFISADLI